jgi:cytochrome P450
MRLYPPAFGVGRQALEECEIGGFRIPAKAQVFAFQWVTQRDPRYFHEPEKFDPDRWNEASINDLPKYAYFPFGGGPRACIGNAFAMMEIILVLAEVGQKFRLALVKDHEVGLMPAMSLRPKNGIKVVVELR